VVRGNGNSKTVTHRELLAVVAGSDAFTIFSGEINPGIYGSFPWLSNEALTYEMYSWRFLGYEYEPSCSTTSTGVVMLAVEFDPTDPLPENENGFMNLCDAVQGPVWSECKYVCNPMNLSRQYKNKYVRFGTVPSSDIHSYDCGKFMYATIGQANTTVIGRIFSRYSCEFYIPNLPSLAERGTYVFDLFNNSQVTATNPLGQDIYPLVHNGNLAVLNQGGGALKFSVLGIVPGEYYRITLKHIGVGIVGTVTMTPDIGWVTVPNNEGWVVTNGTTNHLSQIVLKSVSTGGSVIMTQFTSITSCAYVSINVYGLAQSTDFTY